MRYPPRIRPPRRRFTKRLRTHGTASDASDTGKDGVWLTDGYIYFAILKHGSDEAPNLGAGPSTVVGVHHIGFYVDDLAEACDTIEQAGATECPGSSKVNRKYKGPDGLMIDMRMRGWDEQIKARTQLFQLAPVLPT